MVCSASSTDDAVLRSTDTLADDSHSSAALTPTGDRAFSCTYSTEMSPFLSPFLSLCPHLHLSHHGHTSVTSVTAAACSPFEPWSSARALRPQGCVCIPGNGGGHLHIMTTPLSNVLFRFFSPLPLSPSSASQHTSMLTPVESQCPSARQADSHDADHADVASSLVAAVEVDEGQQADTPRLLPASSAEVARAPPFESEPQADMGDHDDAFKTVHPQPARIAPAGCEDFSLVADAIKQHGVALSPSPPRSSCLPAAESPPTSAAVFTAKGSAYQHLPGPPHAPKAERWESAQPQHRSDSFGGFCSQKRPGKLVEAFNGRWKHDKFIALGVSPKPEPGNRGSDGTVTRPLLAKLPPVAPRAYGLALAVAAGEGNQGVVYVE